MNVAMTFLAALLALGLACGTLVLADITGTDPAAGTCLCITGSGVNIRSTACGAIIGTANTGNCYTYTGTKQACSLSGTNYDFFQFNYGAGIGWTAGTYLNTASAASCSGGGGSGVFTTECMKCICQIESNCNANIGCLMDVGSLSCGAYQIKEAYWIDCGSIGGGWQTCANDLACAETCVQNYMNRYGTYCTGGSAPTCEDYSRIHNGGPSGCTCTCTDGYWSKVMGCCGCQSCCD